MTTQPEALQCAADLEYSISHHGKQDAFTLNAYSAMKMIRAQHARITELEAQLSAIGAGGVEPLRQINQPEPTVPDQTQDWAGMDGATAYLLIQRHADNWADVAKMMGEWLTANQRQSFDAADVATASAQGFRDGVASVSRLTDTQIASACMSYRHDFGLLDDANKAQMVDDARSWEYAFAKEREWAAADGESNV